MTFEMDRQSFFDLGIFQTRESSFNVYQLFKNVKTQGGRAKLDEMMNNPSSDLKLLKDRRDSVEFFKRMEIQLDIDHDQFDLITHYLKLNGGVLRDNPIDSFIAFATDNRRSSQHYYDVRVGVTKLIDLIRYSAELTSLLSAKGSPEHLRAMVHRINRILDNDIVRYVLKLSPKKVLTFRQLSKLDHFIREKYLLSIIEFLHIFYELDVFNTLSDVIRERKFCLPHYLDSADVKIETSGLFHPGFANPVSNDIAIDDSNRLIFLSGSNMSGKSSFLKSLGIALYLSHIGFPVPAQQFKTTIFNGLITTINLVDNIQNGLSHYFSEVARMKYIATKLNLTNRLIVLLDELFKGTNVKDAHDGSQMVIEGLSKVPNSIFVVSSHITELPKVLQNTQIQYLHLENLMVDDKPEFTYRLKKGVSTAELGLYFLQREKIKDLLDHAAMKNTNNSSH